MKFAQILEGVWKRRTLFRFSKLETDRALKSKATEKLVTATDKLGPARRKAYGRKFPETSVFCGTVTNSVFPDLPDSLVDHFRPCLPLSRTTKTFDKSFGLSERRLQTGEHRA